MWKDNEDIITPAKEREIEAFRKLAEQPLPALNPNDFACVGIQYNNLEERIHKEWPDPTKPNERGTNSCKKYTNGKLFKRQNGRDRKRRRK